MHLTWVDIPLAIALLYTLFSWGLVLTFKKRHAQPVKPEKPSLSACVLRPLSGADSGSEALLAGLCVQTQPPSEIRYGVSDAGDPAAAVARRLMEKFPQIRMSLSVGAYEKALNRKMGNLVKLQGNLTAPVVAVIDQDIVVEPDYLENILVPFTDPTVGLVTAAYSLGPPHSFGTALELLAVHSDFFPSILMAEWIEGGLHFGFGATLAMRREALEKIGGFQNFENYLADDYEIGARIHQNGYRVVLSPVIVEHHPGKLSLNDYRVRGIRTARTYRLCRPLGYALTILTQGVPWIIAAALNAGLSGISGLLVLLWCLARAGLVMSSHAVLTDKKPRTWRPLLLLPVHEVMRFIFWITAFLGNQITWGNITYRLLPNGEMRRTNPHNQEKESCS